MCKGSRKVVSWFAFAISYGIPAQQASPVDTFVVVVQTRKEKTRKEKSSFVMHGWSKQRKLQQASSKQQMGAGSKVVLMEWMEWKVVWMATTRSNNKMEVVHKLI